MHYEFPKTVAFSKYTVLVDQDQTKCPWSIPNQIYGVDSTSKSSGIMYADTFHVDVHTRLEKERNSTKINVVAFIVWDKPCLFKSKVETETIKDMKKYYELIVQELQAISGGKTGKLRL